MGNRSVCANRFVYRLSQISRSVSAGGKKTIAAAAMTDWKPVVKSVDMKDEHKAFAEKVVMDALSVHTIEEEIAGYIKQQFDSDHGPSWHCTVGRRFGTYVTHRTKNYIFMSVGNLYILLYKCSKDSALPSASS